MDATEQHSAVERAARFADRLSFSRTGRRLPAVRQFTTRPRLPNSPHRLSAPRTGDVAAGICASAEYADRHHGTLRPGRSVARRDVRYRNPYPAKPRADHSHQQCQSPHRTPRPLPGTTVSEDLPDRSGTGIPVFCQNSTAPGRTGSASSGGHFQSHAAR